MKHTSRKFSLVWTALFLHLSCATPAASAQSQSLGVVGYNYTNQDIGDFSVGGAGGGFVSVSNERSGGGGITCCIRWRDNTDLPLTLRVRWDADRCRFTTPPNNDGETFESIHHMYKEVNVELNGPVPKDPENLEVHFYPDGHIELAITRGSYTPRLKLDARRELPTRRCAAGERNP